VIDDGAAVAAPSVSASVPFGFPLAALPKTAADYSSAES
jgi:hypothetical protein